MLICAILSNKHCYYYYYYYYYCYYYIIIKCDLDFGVWFSLLWQEYQQIVDAEWDILYDKLEKIVQSGAKVVLSKLPIGDVATQYFADR